MSRKKSRTPVQAALLSLRKQLGWSQQTLAVKMDVSVVTVCRWETSRPPSGYSLLQLAGFARYIGANDIAKVFAEELRDEDNSPDYLEFPATAEAPERAIVALRVNRDLPQIEREYLRVLRVLARAHNLLLKQRLSGAAMQATYEQLNETQEELEGELSLAK